MLIAVAGGIVLGALALMFWRVLASAGGLVLAVGAALLLGLLAASAQWSLGWQDIAAMIFIAAAVGGALWFHRLRHVDVKPL